MNEKDLLLAIGDVDAKYYAEAHKRAQAAAPIQEPERADEWYTEASAFGQQPPKQRSLLPILMTIGAGAACIALLIGSAHYMNDESSLSEAVPPVSSAPDTTPPASETIATFPPPVMPLVPLTLDDVIRLSQKGEALTWSDFAQYEYTDVGSGLYIHRYQIDDMFQLSIGGVPESPPLYMVLDYAANADANLYLSIDIRTEDVEKFIEQCIDPAPEALPVTVQQAEAASSLWSDTALSQDMTVLRQASDCNTLGDSVFQDLSLPDALKQDAYYEENVCILVALRTGSSGGQFGIRYANVTADGILELKLSEYGSVGDCVMTSYYFMLTVPRAHLPEIQTLTLSVDCYEDQWQSYLDSLPETLYLTLSS